MACLRRPGIGAALEEIPFIASFSSYLDDTTMMADLILPDDAILESWGDDVPDPGPGYQTVGIQQPVVRRFHDTRNFCDSLLTVGQRLGGTGRERVAMGCPPRSAATRRERAPGAKPWIGANRRRLREVLGKSASTRRLVGRGLKACHYPGREVTAAGGFIGCCIRVRRIGRRISVLLDALSPFYDASRARAPICRGFNQRRIQ